MKIRFFCVLSFLHFFLGWDFVIAQEWSSFPVVDSICLGRNVLTDTPMMAKRLTYPFEVYQVEVDTNTAEVFIVTRNRIRYNFKNNGLLFSHNTNSRQSNFVLPLEKQFDLSFTDSVILVGDRFSKFFYNRNKHNRISKKMQCFIYVNPKNNIGITNHFEGINLLNDSVIWSSSLRNGYIKEVVSMNDSIVLINMDGVHQLNILTGKGWHYEQSTTSHDSNSNEIGLPLCLTLLNQYSVSTKSDKVIGISSQILVKENKIFYASKNSIVCLNSTDGRVIWSHSLPQNYMSTCILRLYKDNLVLIGLGFALKSDKYIVKGKPFIASYSVVTGQEQYFTLTPDASDLVDIKLDYDRIYLIYSGQLNQYDYLTGRFLGSCKPRIDQKWTFSSLFNQTVLFTTDSDKSGYFKNAYSDGIYVFDKAEQSLYSFTPDLVDYKVQDGNQLLVCLLTHPSGLKYIHNKNTHSSFLVDSTLKVVARLNMGSVVQLLGNQIIEINDKSIVVLDLGVFLKP